MDVASEEVAPLPSGLSTSGITPSRVQPIPTHLFSKKKSQALGTSRCPSRQNSLRVSPGGVPLPRAGHPRPPAARPSARLAARAPLPPTLRCPAFGGHTALAGLGARLPRRFLRWVRVPPSFQPPKAGRPGAQPSEAVCVLPAPPAQATSAVTVRTLQAGRPPQQAGVPGNADSAAGWTCPPSARAPAHSPAGLSTPCGPAAALASPRSETCFGSMYSEALTRCINIGQSWAF